MKGHGRRKTRKGTVLIVWGTPGHDLAREVQRRLKGEGFDAHIGGSTEDATQRHLLIPEQVLGQLKGASRAIILAPPDPSRSSRGSGSPPPLRENVMFEWGFLVARLIPAYIHVFLIGIDDGCLPSDLKGAWVKEIPLGSQSRMASQIVDHFRKEVREADAKPLESFKDWHAWKAHIDAQISSQEPSDDLRLAGMLLHSIQPSFYTGEIRDLSARISKISKEPRAPQLQEACRLVTAVCDFYLEAEGLWQTPPERGKLPLGKVRSFVNRFDFVPDRDIDRASRFFLWLETVRNDFLGLAYYEYYLAAETNRRIYLTKAARAYQRAEEMIEEVDHQLRPQRGYAVGLWRGYVFRNLGIVLGHLGGKYSELSVKYLKRALKHRNQALADFVTESIDPHILEQIRLEVLLVKMDLYLRHPKRKPREQDFQDLLLDLEESRPKDRTRGIWHLALVEAAKAARLLGNEKVFGPLHHMLQTEHAEHKTKQDQLLAADEGLNSAEQLWAPNQRAPSH